MNQTLVGVLIGGAIGVIGSILALIGNIYVTKAQTKQNLHRLGFELGMKEYEVLLERFKSLIALDPLDPKRKIPMIYPPWHFVWFNFRILEELSKGNLTAASLQQIENERKKLKEEILASPANPRRDEAQQ